MWPHSCVITTKYAAYHTCLSPTTCRPVFSLSCPSPSSDDRSHMDGNCLMGVGGREGTLLWWMLGHWVIKERNHTSEIPIRMLGRAEAVTFAVLLSTLQTTLKHRHAHTYIQFTLLFFCNYLEGSEDFTAESACLSLCLYAVMHVCLQTVGLHYHFMI